MHHPMNQFVAVIIASMVVSLLWTRVLNVTSCMGCGKRYEHAEDCIFNR